jgi:hypothetical protein
LHGEEALIAFTRVEAGRYSFNAIQYPFRPASMLTHERAVEILEIPLPTPSSPAKPKPVSGSQFTHEELEKLFGKFYFE